MTILIFCFVYISGLVILTLTALPQALHAGAGLGGFVTGASSSLLFERRRPLSMYREPAPYSSHRHRPRNRRH